jgi:hypothetical protein
MMWQHQVGRLDFEKPLFQLMRLGWDFQEITPSAAAQGDVFWAVKGVNGADRVRVDGAERNEAWAEAVRLALMAADERRPLLSALGSETLGGLPNDPSVCDEERARLKQAGWSFTEHATAQARGRKGWVVSGTQGGRRIQAVDDDRLDAWGTALILAAVIGTAPSGAPTNRPAPDGLA